MPKSILVVDDNEDLRELVSSALTQAGYDVFGAPNASEGLRIAAQQEPELVLLDIMMPGMDGLEMLARLRERDKEMPVIVMTAHSTPETVISAMREQACDFLAKPFDMDDLVSAVNAVFAIAPQEIAIKVLSARPEWVELRVPCSMAAIDPLERLITQLEMDIPPTTRDNITYAFREMLRNAIEYGGKNDPTKFVEVGYLHSPRVIIYRIKDPGEGFSIEALRHAAILNPEGDPVRHERVREELGMRPGGFGILIARNMVDEMIYNERHNEVLLIKYLDDEPAS